MLAREDASIGQWGALISLAAGVATSAISAAAAKRTAAAQERIANAQARAAEAQATAAEMGSRGFGGGSALTYVLIGVGVIAVGGIGYLLIKKA